MPAKLEAVSGRGLNTNRVSMVLTLTGLVVEIYNAVFREYTKKGRVIQTIE